MYKVLYLRDDGLLYQEKKKDEDSAALRIALVWLDLGLKPGLPDNWRISIYLYIYIYI